MSRPSIHWLQSDEEEVELEDETWSLSYHHTSSDGSIINIKTGNKRYILSQTGESAVDPKRKITPEAVLYKKYK